MARERTLGEIAALRDSLRFAQSVLDTRGDATDVRQVLRRLLDVVESLALDTPFGRNAAEREHVRYKGEGR